MTKRLTLLTLVCLIVSLASSHGRSVDGGVYACDGGLYANGDNGLYANGDEAYADTTMQISEVTVVARHMQRELSPAQTLSADELERLPSRDVADALRYFSGLQVKDYGGVGGMKTVNIRSLGASHLGVFYDGVQMGNAQNGQTDLGQLALDNVEEITLYNGQKNAIFHSASEFGHAGSVYIQTRQPVFASGHGSRLRLRAKYGSGHTLNATALWEQQRHGGVKTSLTAGVLSSSGKYKFRRSQTLPGGTTAWDTTATRQNGDIVALRLEGNMFGTFMGAQWHVKAFGYSSNRGMPGVILSNVWRSGERQTDNTAFLQARIQRSFGEKFSTKLQMKGAYYHTHYLNRDTTRYMADNTYRQREFFVSTSNIYALTSWWHISAAYDFKLQSMSSDMSNFVRPRRHTHTFALATAIDLSRLKIQASLMGDIVSDRERLTSVTRRREAFSPSIHMAWQPFSSTDLTLRAFAKRSFRMPTFNDLYYVDIGKATLAPEYATQLDAGVSWQQTWREGIVESISVRADAYYNEVDDKIVAFPQGQQFRWTMMNLGKVDIRGIDSEAAIALRPTSEMRLSLRAQYTYQKARDITDARSACYKHQIPYIPLHSGSAMASIDYRQWQLNYSLLYTGERYSQRENSAVNRMEAWHTSDISLAYRFGWQGTQWRVAAEMTNMFDQQYDVVKNYPMPGRQFFISAEVKL